MYPAAVVDAVVTRDRRVIVGSGRGMEGDVALLMLFPHYGYLSFVRTNAPSCSVTDADYKRSAVGLSGLSWPHRSHLSVLGNRRSPRRRGAAGVGDVRGERGPRSLFGSIHAATSSFIMGCKAERWACRYGTQMRRECTHCGAWTFRRICRGCGSNQLERLEPALLNAPAPGPRDDVPLLAASSRWPDRAPSRRARP
jgi:hypothetical protein